MYYHNALFLYILIYYTLYGIIYAKYRIPIVTQVSDESTSNEKEFINDDLRRRRYIVDKTLFLNHQKLKSFFHCTFYPCDALLSLNLNNNFSILNNTKPFENNLYQSNINNKNHWLRYNDRITLENSRLEYQHFVYGETYIIQQQQQSDNHLLSPSEMLPYLKPISFNEKKHYHHFDQSQTHYTWKDSNIVTTNENDPKYFLNNASHILKIHLKSPQWNKWLMIWMYNNYKIDSNKKYLTTLETITAAYILYSKILLAILQLDISYLNTMFSIEDKKQLQMALHSIKPFPGLPMLTNIVVQLPGNVGFYILTKLIEAGADVNQADEKGRTPLMIASLLGKPRIVQWLLEHYADVRKVDKKSQSALHYAARSNNPETLRVLVFWGANPNQIASSALANDASLHILLRYATRNLLESVEVLLEFYGSGVQKNKWQQSPLEIAIEKKFIDVTERLLQENLQPLVASRELRGKFTSHFLFNSIASLLPEYTVLKLLNVIIERKDVSLLCDTRSTKHRNLLWQALWAGYFNVAHRLLDFYGEARDNKYDGYEYCNPHAPDYAGHSPIEIFLIMHRRDFENPDKASAAGSILKRLLKKGDPISDASYLIQAIRREAETMQKVSTVTFSTISDDDTTNFKFPPPLGLDDLYLTLSTIPSTNNAADSVTPLMTAISKNRRRTQRVLFKAMTVSLLENVNTFDIWRHALRALLESIDQGTPWTISLAVTIEPRFIQDILALVTPGDVSPFVIKILKKEYLTPDWYFSGVDYSPLENAVWFDMSPLSEVTTPMVSELMSEKRVLASSPQDCRRALMALHQASLYFRRFQHKNSLLKSSFLHKQRNILQKIFQSPILNVHENLLLISGFVTQAQTLVVVTIVVSMFVVTRLPSVARQCCDPFNVTPPAVYENKFSFFKWTTAAFIEGLSTLIGLRGFLSTYDHNSRRIHKSKWSVSLAVIVIQWIASIRVIESLYFRHSLDLSISLCLMAITVIFQCILICQTTSVQSSKFFHQCLDLFHIYPCESFLEVKSILKQTAITNINHFDDKDFSTDSSKKLLLSSVTANNVKKEAAEHKLLEVLQQRLVDIETISDGTQNGFDLKKRIFSVKMDILKDITPTYFSLRSRQPLKQELILLTLQLLPILRYDILSSCKNDALSEGNEEDKDSWKTTEESENTEEDNDEGYKTEDKEESNEKSNKEKQSNRFLLFHSHWPSLKYLISHQNNFTERCSMQHNSRYAKKKKRYVEKKTQKPMSFIHSESLINYYQYLVCTTVSRQFKIPATEYSNIMLSILGMCFVISTLPHIGGAFLSNYAAVYQDTFRMELALKFPFYAFTFEWAYSIITAFLLFSFLKPVGFVLMFIQQRQRIVDAIKNVSPVTLKEHLLLSFSNNTSAQHQSNREPLTKHYNDTILWELMETWTIVWRRSLYRSNMLGKTAVPILNVMAFISFCLTLWFFHCIKMNIDILRTRTGLLLLALTTCLIILVAYAVSQASHYNRSELKSWEWIDDLYSSCRLLSSDHDILQDHFAKVSMIDSQGLKLFGFYISNFCNRLIQVTTIPSIIFLIVTAIQYEAPPLYI